jgi:hypothetical protein
MVSVFAIGPKVRRFKAGRERWIFNGYKNRSTSSFGGEVKPSAQPRKILLHVKELCGVENTISRRVSPASLPDRVMMNESEIIRTQMRTHSRS